MNCREVRDRLSAKPAVPGTGVAGHLSDCVACARFARRMQTARALLREHHGNVEPDAAFAPRLAARLRVVPEVKLGWAAVRVLPATIALLLVLAWLAWQATPDPTSLLAESPTDDVLTWVLTATGEGS